MFKIFTTVSIFCISMVLFSSFLEANECSEFTKKISSEGWLNGKENSTFLCGDIEEKVISCLKLCNKGNPGGINEDMHETNYNTCRIVSDYCCTVHADEAYGCKEVNVGQPDSELITKFSDAK